LADEPLNLNVPDYEHLQPFIREENIKFVSYLLAARYRRGRARNAAAKHGTGTVAEPSFISGADRDLYEYYQNLVKTAELEQVAADLYAVILDKKMQAELLIERLRDSEELGYDQRREMLLELNELEDDITRMTGVLEDLNNA
jgi:hypothetical protein